MPDVIDTWLTALIARHTQAMSRPEFLKAVRALSARYVERRADLPGRSPIDSAGKRAAFAAFFAPIHFVTTRALVRELDAARPSIREIVDLGCGTGVASAAWALQFRAAPGLLGFDKNPWALGEAAWNWRALGLHGRTRRGDLIAALTDLARASRRARPDSAIVLAWAVNELDERTRAALLPLVLARARTGQAVLVIEPLAKSAVPWWDTWARAWTQAGGRADEWKLNVALPAALAEISEAAGFRRGVSARTLWLSGATEP